MILILVNMLELFLFVLLAGSTLAVVQVNAKNQTGFVSLDCGLPRDSKSYNETTTEIHYISDYGFIETGVNKSILPEFQAGKRQETWHLRSFPDGFRSCYRFNLTKGNKYLIRAVFLYGNYDELGKLPKFDLYIGPNKWETISLTNTSTVSIKELIHVLTRSYLHVCLVNTDSGVPFINAIEIRPMDNATYNNTESVSFNLLARLDIASESNQTIRYKDDVYDRIWTPYNSGEWTQLSTNLTIDSDNMNNNYLPASIVMRTAAVPKNVSGSLDIILDIDEPNLQFYTYVHFAEIQKLQDNESRKMKTFVEGKWHGNLSTDVYLYTTTYYWRTLASSIEGGNYTLSIQRDENSTLPPILNAIEVFSVKDFLELQTDENDVDAILKIKSIYGLKQNWQGDPCAPRAYLWDGLNCSNTDDGPPRIISLKLSSWGLTGEIPLDLINLTSIEYLDLSHNDLAGSVPEFLAKMPSLRTLNLTGNNLSGLLPVELIERSNNHSLILSVSENPHLCTLVSCQRKNKRSFVIPVASAATLLIILIALATWWSIRRKRQTAFKDNAKVSLELESGQFTFSEVVRATDNFNRVLGTGGFGTVYHGKLDDSTQVAVKMLSSSSRQGYKEFHAELKLLMKVHHRNLINLVGYCNEGSHMGLIYEYMANGSLQQRLSDKNEPLLSWEGRLRIAVDAAQGLEYLHKRCKPPIIHRDIKSTNILLNDKFEAKLADFGLSKIFPIEGGTHVSTVVAGTPGYLDPEYYQTNRLTEKSDIYSFGVVLLEIITSRPAIINNENEDSRIHVSQLVTSMTTEGEIEDIIDPGLSGEFEIVSARKAVELALSCASHTSSKRPNMDELVMELKECLVMEIARKTNSCDIEPDNGRDMISTNEDSESSVSN